MATKENAILLAQMLAYVAFPIELTTERLNELKRDDRQRYGTRRHVAAKVTRSCRKARA